METSSSLSECGECQYLASFTASRFSLTTKLKDEIIQGFCKDIWNAQFPDFDDNSDWKFYRIKRFCKHASILVESSNYTSVCFFVHITLFQGKVKPKFQSCGCDVRNTLSNKYTVELIGEKTISGRNIVLTTLESAAGMGDYSYSSNNCQDFCEVCVISE